MRCRWKACIRCNGAFSASSTAATGVPACRIELPITFYARYAADIARKAFVLAKRWRMLEAILNKIEADPNAKLYMDERPDAVTEEDAEHMELYTQNEAARTAVERERRVAAKPGHAHPLTRMPAMAMDGNGHEGNGHGDAHHDHHAHEHEEPRPEASPPA